MAAYDMNTMKGALKKVMKPSIEDRPSARIVDKPSIRIIDKPSVKIAPERQAFKGALQTLGPVNGRGMDALKAPRKRI